MAKNLHAARRRRLHRPLRRPARAQGRPSRLRLRRRGRIELRPGLAPARSCRKATCARWWTRCRASSSPWARSSPRPTRTRRPRRSRASAKSTCGGWSGRSIGSPRSCPRCATSSSPAARARERPCTSAAPSAAAPSARRWSWPTPRRCPAQALAYVNRLSDLLFVMARAANLRAGGRGDSLGAGRDEAVRPGRRSHRRLAALPAAAGRRLRAARCLGRGAGLRERLPASGAAGGRGRRTPLAAVGRIECHAHGARFDPATGNCTGGPCDGRALTPLPIEERDGAAWLASGE